MSDGRPNILIFQTDHERADVVVEGHPCRTPHVERLAREGVRFSRMFTVAAHCCPSRATFMTGLYPSHHGIYNNVANTMAIHMGLKPGVRTFSERLREAGYTLSYSGKWHVSHTENPADRGWEENLVTAGADAHHGVTWEDWRERAREAPDDAPRRRGEIVCPGYFRRFLYGKRGREIGDDPDYRIVQAGVRALREVSARVQPWCVYIGLSGPHDPYMIPEKYATMYDPKAIALPPNYHDDLADKPRIYQRQRRQLWDQLSEDEVREAIAHFWGYCTMLDEMFGEVMDGLEATGQAENTLVVRNSDHGDLVGAHGLFLKGVPAFDEAYRVPTVVRWPSGVVRPGRVEEVLVTHADMAPTFLDAARAPALPTSGRSLMPWLRDVTPEDPPDAVFTQFNGVELYYTQRAVRTHEYKYVFNGFDFDELYDLRNDPYEQRNLTDDPSMESVKRDLVRRMWRFNARENDIMKNMYPTVALVPWGPADAL